MPGIRDTIGVFVRNRPSIRALLSSRRSSFDRAHPILPSNAVVGEEMTATVQAWDEYERLLRDFEGAFAASSTDPDASLPDRVDLEPGDDGWTKAGGIAFGTPGIQYLRLVHADTGEAFASNPALVTAEEPDHRLYWGDIHLHSRRSDGAGSIEKGMRFGRDVMDLDVVAYTDHDTMGFFIPPGLQRRFMHRRHFEDTKDLVAEFHDPGGFVTLMAYEWTKQPNRGGHINVYFEDVDDAELFDSLSTESRTYERLWARLREWREENEGDVLTIPHHPAEEMYPFDFSAVEYDDDLAPLVEVYSQWGSNERPGHEGNRYPLAMGQGEIETPGHYVQDALAMGHRVGMMASADYHGPFPGHSLIHADPHLPRLREILDDGFRWGHIWRIWDERSYPGGLVAFYAPELTRGAIFESLRRRRVYGTAQPARILVEFQVAGTRLRDDTNEVTIAAPDTPRPVEFRVAGTAPVERVTVVKNNEAWRVAEGTADPDAGLDSYVVEGSYEDTEPVVGMAWDDDRGADADAYYLRVRQADDRAAWGGPIWVGSE